jgi:phage-related tail protein|tara:strand:+ start:15 stop:473 length:459 start_codon:yes stop_codon:yes gene_type:complete
MTNEKTSVEFRKEIRKLCGLDVHAKAWFTRNEAKEICKKINSGACFISDDKSKQSYVSVSNMFPTYIRSWKDQVTVNDHPSRENLEIMYNILSSKKKPLAAVIPKVKKNTVIIKNTANSVQDFLKSLPPEISSRAKSIELVTSGHTIKVNLQ